ncbi:hypothetical protein QZH41_019449, partial [Actinostola sp. cb2023]
MYQTVGHQAIDIYAEAMGLPLYRRTIQGSSIEIGKNYVKNDQDEVEDLYQLLLSIKSKIEFDAVSSGAILSDYQRVRVEHVDDSKVVIHSDDAFAQVGYLQLNAVHLMEKHKVRLESEKSLDQEIKELPEPYCGDPVDNVPGIVPNTESNCEHTKKNIGFSILTQEHYQETILYNDTNGYVWISGLKGYKQDNLTVQQITKTVMDKLKDKITLLNSSLDDVILMQLFVKNMSDFSQVNSVYKCYFPVNPPARACVEVDLEEDCLIQFDCLLYRSIVDTSNIVVEPEIPRHTREAMHVQSISHWASANIGPYSQVIKASENCGNEVVRLVSYIVIPSLPKGALVEWQFIAHHDAGQWK